MILARKLLRQVRAQRGQVIAVVAVCVLGAMLFVGSYAGYDNLSDSYIATQKRLALADLRIDVAGISAAELDAVRSAPAVAAAEARVEIELPVRIVSNDARFTARVLSLPRAQQPALDRLYLVDGRLPGAPGEVVVDQHLATFQHFGVGDGIQIPGIDGTLAIVGIAVSPEYLWVSRSNEDVMPSPQTFGIMWMTRDGLRVVATALQHNVALAAASPAIALAASSAVGSKLLFTPALDRASALAAVHKVLGDRARDVTTAEDLVGTKLLRLDVDGLKEMALFFPLFFLAVAAFIVASIVGRMVDAETPLIGTLRALGASRARVMLHYTSFAIGIAGVGAAVGAALGLPMGAAMTTSYAVELGIPFVTTGVHAELFFIALLVGVLIGAAAGALPSWRASTLAPAVAMRGGEARESLWLLRLLRALPRSIPLPARLALRSVVRRPLRSVATTLGVAAALTLVVTTSAVLDSTKKTMSVMFDEQQPADVRLDLLGPVDARLLRDRIHGIPGVGELELFLVLPVQIAHGAHQATTLLQALPDASPLLRAVDLANGPVAAAAGTAVVPRPLARKLGVNVGDDVTVSLPGAPSAAAHFRVGAVIDVPVGEAVTVRLDDAQRAFALDGNVTGAVLRTQPSSRAAVREALEDYPGVARVEDSVALRETVKTLMGLAWIVLAIMLALSVVLAAAILFNTATLSILERRRDLATLRALGLGMRGVAVSLSIENAILAAAGIAVGVPASMVIVRAALRLFSSDLMAFPVVFSPTTFISAIIGAALVLAIAQAPALRSVARMSLPAVLRLRGR